MSDTPRTDAATFPAKAMLRDTLVVGVEVARALERELGEATRANAVRVQIIRGLNGEVAALRRKSATRRAFHREANLYLVAWALLILSVCALGGVAWLA